MNTDYIDEIFYAQGMDKSSPTIELELKCFKLGFLLGQDFQKRMTDIRARP